MVRIPFQSLISVIMFISSKEFLEIQATLNTGIHSSNVSLNTDMWHNKYTSQCFQVLQFYSALISMIKLLCWRKLFFFLFFTISMRRPDEKNRITHFVTVPSYFGGNEWWGAQSHIVLKVLLKSFAQVRWDKILPLVLLQYLKRLRSAWMKFSLCILLNGVYSIITD